MRFRQWICPTHKNLYDLCLNQTAFFHPDGIEECRPDHNYARPWVDDPTLSTALPAVHLFSSSSTSSDPLIDIEPSTSSTEKINWAPLMNTIIPERFECPQQPSDQLLTTEQETFAQSVRELIDQTRLAVLSSESNAVYWRLAVHRIVYKLNSLFTDQPNYIQLLEWLHEYVCQNLDRISLGHYVDLFQILYDEYPELRSAFVQTGKSWPTSSLCSYVYDQVIEKPNDFTEEVIYSLPLSNLPIPMICLMIPGVALGNHMKRVEFWQKNLSQITTVIVSNPIDKDQTQIQSAYDDILKKFQEIRQLYPNHKIMFLAWNVGCILALKAALVCPIATIVCLALPFLALSDETKNDFIQINGSILFVTGDHRSASFIDRYRQRLKSRNGFIQLGFTDEQLRMSEDGKSRFRLTQQMIDKLLMEEILDFITILSPRSTRPMDSSEEIDLENKKKKIERTIVPTNDESDEIFLYTGENATNGQIQTLTIPPEQDPQTIFLNITLPTTNTRKRKNVSEQNRAAPKETKRGRQKTKNVANSDNPWGSEPVKPAGRKSKQPMTPTATTSILNTLLQLPTNQPKARAPISKAQPVVNNLLSSSSTNPFV